MDYHHELRVDEWGKGFVGELDYRQEAPLDSWKVGTVLPKHQNSTDLWRRQMQSLSHATLRALLLVEQSPLLFLNKILNWI